jgi:hypothetical protein
MTTPVESATLILKLFELRREPVLREARAWFLREFNPQTFEEALDLAGGPRNDWFRMVMGYWDMASSFVVHGAIDAEMFRAANTEMVATFAKIEPFIVRLREVSGIPEFATHMETVVRACRARSSAWRCCGSSSRRCPAISVVSRPFRRERSSRTENPHHLAPSRGDDRFRGGGARRTVAARGGRGAEAAALHVDRHERTPADRRPGVVFGTTNPQTLLRHLATLTVEGLFHLKDLAPHLTDPATIRAFKDAAQVFSRSRSMIILTGDHLALPGELAREVVPLRLQLPDHDELRQMLHRVVHTLRTKHKFEVTLGPDGLEQVLQALAGLTLNQARQALAWAILSDGMLAQEDVPRLVRRKGESIQDGGLLEFYPPAENAFELGGFDRLKAWLNRAKVGFTTRHTSAGFSGAEIEQAVIASLYRAIHDKTPLTTPRIVDELERTVPLSVSRREDIERLRAAGRERFVPVR